MCAKISAYVLDDGDLHDYLTGDYLRAGTAEEKIRSIEAARHDGGAGVIEVSRESIEGGE